MLNIPEFETQLRGFDRDEVADYVDRLQRKFEFLQQRTKSLDATERQARSDCERLAAEVARLKNDIAVRAADAEAQRRELIAEMTYLHSQVEQVSEPAESVEGMSDRIARMMRIASEEARRTKELARQEAEALTGELREKLTAARYDRAAANRELSELQASAEARRAKILEIATAEADEILRLAQEERDRIVQEAEAGAASRRAVYQRLAEEEERNRLAAQEVLDEQMKAAWEEDERHRGEAQRRLDQRLKAAWEQADAAIVELDKRAHWEAATLVANAQHEARALDERAQSEVAVLEQERAELVADLKLIKNWINTAG
ncbi:hypothetical protein MU0083_001993 [[Mycobacterium] kokjensenii]|uniref:Cell division protein DivIVA n=1 Tax=[Mycobacterium] kokjensenii TaxID=3064287 RepID=A0ABN9N191_9MYCO|nr:hypothetical protein [Mycolicibacter sp. MU0083]CAJ1498695.1 hypothetical protein MU0083_001993 [Mycolicibacter sp. MU0083]